MAANLEDQLIDKVRALPPDKQQEALRLLDTLATEPSSESHGTRVDRRPIGKLSKKSTVGYLKIPGTTYQPTARLILIIPSMERRSSSRESRLC
jgi:transcriptional regulator with AAA-type ATPase domain